ncbi:MAG TPA: SRPBCC domain-containing protein [Bryobacterales bacterium]|nr:SRPBCC domain-containing protein [Bryobacterales bacterium]
MSAQESNDTLVVRRLIPATREEVFAAWTDPESIKHWMCPGDATTAEAQLDPRVGGKFRIVMKGRSQDYEHTGEYQVVEPPSKLVFTWTSKGTDDQPTLVTVELFARGEHCELVLTHARFPRVEAMRSHKNGWSQITDRLAEHVQTRPEAAGAVRSLEQEVTFSASPHEVFEALLDAGKHSAFTGAPAEIERKPGGRFSLYGGQLSGVTVTFIQDQRILQQWRSANWPEGTFSHLYYILSPLDGGGTRLLLTQTGVPAQHFADINRGWHKYYWAKMAEYLRNEKIAIVRRFTEEFKNKQNVGVVDELFSPDFAFHLPVKGLPPGREGLKTIGKAIFAAFPDVHVTPEDVIVEGDRVVARDTARATHRGEFNGVPATGRKVYWTENHIYRLENGKIAEVWSETSFQDLMAQVASPQPARAKA